MKVQDAYEVWVDAESVRTDILALRNKIEALSIEPELVSKLNTALTDVSVVIACVRYYDVAEDETAKNRRVDWEKYCLKPPGWTGPGEYQEGQEK